MDRIAGAGRRRGYHALITEARQALGELQRLKVGVGWLERFDPGEAKVGRIRGVHPRGPRALVEDQRGTQFDAGHLLDLAAKVDEPTAVELHRQREEESLARQAETRAAPSSHKTRSFA